MDSQKHDMGGIDIGRSHPSVSTLSWELQLPFREFGNITSRSATAAETDSSGEGTDDSD